MLRNLYLSMTLMIVAFGFAAAQEVNDQPEDPAPQSPLVSRLMADFQERGEKAVTEFWQKIETSKTPVIEKSGTPNHSWVTFFYRGGAGVERVQLNSAITAAAVEGLVVEGMDIGIFQRLGKTDVRYYSLLLPDNLRTTYRLNVTDEAGRKTVLDPLAAQTYAPGSPWQESVLSLPKAPPQPWRNQAAGGTWKDIEIESRALGRKSTINVYLPESRDRAGAKDWNVFIGMDGIGYRDPLVPTDRIVEYLMNRGEISPTILVLTEDLSGIGDETEKGYEPVAGFLADEVLPVVREKFGVDAKPSRVVVSGKSRRGMISAYAAFKRPDAFGKVLSLSGSYFWKPADQTEYELIPRMYARAEKKPIEFYLSAGIYERFVSPRNVGHYLLATNRHMRDVLEAKDYEFKYEEFPATHRELNWEDQLVAGFRYLLGK